MILRMTLERPAAGLWDGGARSTFDYRIDGPPRRDARGRFVRVGSWAANTWFHVALGRTARATLGNARRRLTARARRTGTVCRFDYIDNGTSTFESAVFVGGPR